MAGFEPLPSDFDLESILGAAQPTQAAPAPESTYEPLPPGFRLPGMPEEAVPVTTAAAQAFRPLTPRRMGEYLEQKTLPQFEEGQRKVEAERATKLPAAQWETQNLSPAMTKALAATGSAAQGMTADTFAYLPALAAKGLGKAGVSGYEQYAEMPLVEAKKAAERKISGASTLEPEYGLAGTLGGVGLGMATMPAVAPARGAAVSGAATGALYGGISGGAQEGDIKDALTGALVGGVGGAVLAPVIERVASGLTRLVTGGRPVVDASGALTTEARALAKQSGLTDEQINLLEPQLQATFEKRGLTPEAAKEARFAEFGIEPKRGMVSDDLEQLAKEAKFGDYGPIAAKAGEAAQEVVGGTQVPLRTAVEDAIAAGQKGAQSLKSSVDAAYEAAASAPGSFSRETLTNVGDKLLGGLTMDRKAQAFRKSTVVQNAAKKLNDDLGQFESSGPGGPEIMWMDFNAVEGARKGLNKAFGEAVDKTDKAGMRRLINDFDQYVENAINNGAFSGDKAVVDQWRTARKLFSTYQDRFGVKKTGEQAGNLMRSVLDNTKTPDQVGNMMFNFAASGDAAIKRDALKVFFQLRRALGPNSPELETIKRSYVQQMMTPTKSGAEFAPKDFTNTAKQIDNFLRGSASDFARKTLAKEDLAMLARYADVMRMAGKDPKTLTPARLGAFGQTAAATAPVVASAASYALGAVHPVLAAGLGAAGALAGRWGAIKGSEYMAQRAANLPPKNVPRSYQFPSVRTGVPLATTAVPAVEEQLSDIERPTRATGGRIGGSDIMRAAERAKKSIQQATKPLLATPDESVVKALAVANKNLEASA